MKTRTIVALAVLAVIGALVVWKVTGKDPHVRDPKATAKAHGIPTLDATAIDELEIQEPGKPLVHLKKDGDWKLVAPVADRADQKNVDATLQALAKMKVKDVVAESATSYEKLGVRDEDVVKVVARKGGQPVTTLLVGKTGKQIRLEGKPQVWEVADFTRFVLTREPKMWRDREIVRYERDQLDRLEVSWPAGGKVAAKREAPPPPPETGDPAQTVKPPAGPDKWTIVEGQAAVGGPLDEMVPGQISSTLSRLDAGDFVEGETDVGPVRATVTAVLEDGSKKELIVGKEDGQDVWVKRPDSPRLWKIRKASADNLIKTAVQWRDKTLAKLDTKDLQRIEIVKDGRLVFERVDEKTWKAVEPADLADVDSSKVQGLATGFANLRASAIVEKPDPKKTGFAPRPTATITAKTKDGKTATLTVGALADKSYFVKVAGRAEVFSVGEFLVSRYLKPAADFKKQAGPAATGAGMPPGMPPGHPM
jgi:hypothetical protein